MKQYGESRGNIMKKLKLKPPFLKYLMRLIQDYKQADKDVKNFIHTSIDALLSDYSNFYGYKSIKFIPTWWKKDNGKVYLSVKFQLEYLDGVKMYYTFSYFDKIIKAYNE